MKENLLNYDSKIFEIKNNFEWEYDQYFIRPCLDNKIFTGKVFNKKDVYNVQFKGKGMDFELELIKELIKRNVTIVEIPVDFNPSSPKRDFKFTIVNGFIAIRYLFFIKKTN